MLFHHIHFFLFFAVVYVLYLALKHRLQNRMLLIASYIFYGFWDWRFLGLIFISTVIDFISGWAVHDSIHHKKKWLSFSIISNLGILAYFKYRGFFVENFIALLGSVGWEINYNLLTIILPVGISFYTFQSMSYTIDIYRGKTKPIYYGLPNIRIQSRRKEICSSFLDFALYVSFFPQLVAGPIERSTTLLPQVQQARTITYQKIADGCFLFFLGLAMKIGIADIVSTQVDSIFANLLAATPIKIYAATAGFTMQVYCDFTGYSLMAKGIASMMGFRLMTNFRQPFFASSFSDLWQRWHVSLSTWARDYIFIPLGGSRTSKSRIAFNQFLTMLLIGIWHGPAWCFAGFGGINGAYLVIERFFRDPVKGWIDQLSLLFRFTLRFAYHIIVLNGFFLAVLIFRAGDLGIFFNNCVILLKRGIWGSVSDLPYKMPDFQPFLLFALLILIYELPCWLKGKDLFPKNLGVFHRGALYILLILILLSAGGEKIEPFFYFQF